MVVWVSWEAGFGHTGWGGRGTDMIDPSDEVTPFVGAVGILCGWRLL